MKLYRNKIISILILAIIVLASLLLSACGKEESNFNSFKTFEDLKGCTFAISDGNSSYEKNISEELPDVKFDRYTNYFDTFIAVANGNADVAFAFKYTFYGIKESYPNLDYVESNIKIPIVASFSNESNELKDDFNNFVAEAKESGLIEKLAEKWMYKYDELGDEDIVDFSDLDGTNGTFKFAMCDTNIPYEYLRGGKIAGFEPALLYEFCKARGYKPEVIQSLFDAVVAGVSSGKYDMAMSGFGYTNERDENSNFSDPYFNDSVAYTVNGASGPQGIFGDIKGSFDRTFIKQGRWKLFANGILITILITTLSVILGSLAGFGLFLISHRRKWLKKLSLGINDTLEALPVLVVLMVFFYIIFGKSSISGVIVSTIVFALNFAFTFFALITNSVRGVPADQTEAGLALGYNSRQTLFKVVLPQAMESFIPSIRSAIIATLKSTAIVGYVAVQDLTKAGDLIRSQTFEAFIPIISVALIYYLIAKFLIFILNRVLVTPSEMRSKRREGK